MQGISLLRGGEGDRACRVSVEDRGVRKRLLER